MEHSELYRIVHNAKMSKENAHESLSESTH